jgi:hypothetical protein
LIHNERGQANQEEENKQTNKRRDGVMEDENDEPQL